MSVGMLTEGWDCRTVTHIVGLRPFMSQLLCEQVVGRGLRRSSYDLGENSRFSEEVAKVLGVPFEVIPFKANPQGAASLAPKRWHIHALPEKEDLAITFPRVEGYTYAIRNRVTVDWDHVAPIELDPTRIPPGADVKGLSVSERGKLSLHGPGRQERISLEDFRAKRRIQELEFDLAHYLTTQCQAAGNCQVPAQALLPQLHAIVRRYLREKVWVFPDTHLKDVFLSPYYGWATERLVEAIRPDTSAGEAPEVPRYEVNREEGATKDVDFWTSRDVREITRSPTLSPTPRNGSSQPRTTSIATITSSHLPRTQAWGLRSLTFTTVRSMTTFRTSWRASSTAVEKSVP